MRVVIEVPDPVWFAAAAEYEKANLKMPQAILLHLIQVAETESRVNAQASARRALVIRLVTDGWTDQRISESTGESRTFIGDVRRRVGLKPNRPGSKTSERKAS